MFHILVKKKYLRTFKFHFGKKCFKRPKCQAKNLWIIENVKLLKMLVVTISVKKFSVCCSRLVRLCVCVHECFPESAVSSNFTFQ